MTALGRLIFAHTPGRFGLPSWFSTNISEEYKQYQLTINKIGFITGEESKQVSLSELAKAIVSGEDNYEGYIESSETGWRESVREHGEYGPTTLIDIIINPDGSELDVDLNKIKTKSKIVNTVLHTFGFLKFPTPTFEFMNGNIVFHPIYY